MSPGWDFPVWWKKDETKTGGSSAHLHISPRGGSYWEMVQDQVGSDDEGGAGRSLRRMSHALLMTGERATKGGLSRTHLNIFIFSWN